jgi:hypothetical protein
VEQIIYLEVDDDIAAVRDRLEWAQARRVLLVIPPQCRTLSNLVNLKLLQRHAHNLAMEAALVTRDGTTRELAQEVGLPVFSSLGRAQRAKWYGRRVVEKAPTRPKEYKGTRPREPRLSAWSASPGRGQQILAVAFFSILFLFLAAAVLLLVPSATVTLRPVSEAVSETLLVQANPELESIDYQTGEIPARIVEVEVEATDHIPTTTKRDAADVRATGTVIFVNKITEPVEIPLGTVVGTSAGTNIRFTTIETATLPSAIGGTAETGIVAVEPGPSGNVDAFMINTIEGPLSLQVRVVNDKPTGGGNMKQVGVVTQADKDRLKASLLQKLQQEAYNRILEELKEQEFVPPETLVVEVVSETYDKFVDEEADVLGMKMVVSASGTAIGGQDANALVYRLLEAKVREGYQLTTEGLRFELGQIVAVEGRNVSFTMQAFGLIVPVIDLNTVINDIRGRPIEEAEDLLSQRFPLKERPVIEVAPDWLGRVPLLPFNIDASIELEESTEKTSEVSMLCAFLGFSLCALVSTGLNVWPKPRRSERLPGVGI